MRQEPEIQEVDMKAFMLRLNGAGNVLCLLGLLIATVAGISWVLMQPWPWPGRVAVIGIALFTWGCLLCALSHAPTRPLA